MIPNRPKSAKPSPTNEALLRDLMQTIEQAEAKLSSASILSTERFPETLTSVARSVHQRAEELFAALRHEPD